MTSSEIKNSLDTIRKVMDEPVSIDNVTGVAEKLEKLSVLLGLSAECIAWARKHYDTRLGFLATSKAYKDMTATDRKYVFASEASQEIFMVNYAESLNKDLHYCCESLRTLVSLLKQEMRAVA